MTRTARGAGRALLLAAHLALGGCAAESIPFACSGERECPPPSSLLSFSAQLWPGAAAGMPRPGSGEQGVLTPQEEPSLIFDAEGLVRLRFTQAAQLRGTLVDELGAPVGRARVVALLPSGIPGQAEQSFDTATDSAGGFALRLPVPRRPEEQPYRLWVGFDDPELAAQRPPLWRTGVVVRGDTQIGVKLRPIAELVTVRGNVVDSAGAGVPGLRVQVIDSRREVVSSTAVTRAQGGAEPVGSFRVLVDPTLTQDSKLQLVAWPTTGKAPRRQPILTLPLSRPESGTSVALDFKMPPYPDPVDTVLTVRGTGTSGARVEVAGARVEAQVFLHDPLLTGQQTATYVVTGETDSRGRVTLPLVPGGNKTLAYTISVQCPAQSPLASGVFSVQVGTSPGQIDLPQLPLRAQVSGQLVDADGLGVAGALLVARSIPDETQGTGQIGGVVLETAMPQTTTDHEGRFALRLDQGDYDLDIMPMPGTQARFSLDSQRVLTDDIELGVMRLPRPTLGKATVLGPDGYPVAGASLRVFQMPDAAARTCDRARPCSRAAKLRAEVTTDSRGRAQFLLPDAP
jgi:hypothetical protein